MADKSAWEKMEEEREKQRINKINNAINSNNGLLKTYRDWNSSLATIRDNMQKSIDHWEDAKKTFYQCDIAKNVVKKNIFEGTASETVRTKNSQKIQKVDGKISDARSVKDKINGQINIINGKIGAVETQNTQLRSQL